MIEQMDQMGLTKAKYLGIEFGTHRYEAWDHHSGIWVVVKFYNNGDVFVNYGE